MFFCGRHIAFSINILQCGGERSATPLLKLCSARKRRRRCALPAHSKAPL